MLITKPTIIKIYKIMAVYAFSVSIGISCHILRRIIVCNKNKQTKINQKKIFIEQVIIKKAKSKTLLYFISIFLNKFCIVTLNVILKLLYDYNTKYKEISKNFLLSCLSQSYMRLELFFRIII